MTYEPHQPMGFVGSMVRPTDVPSLPVAGEVGYWVKAADDDGRAEVTTSPSGVGAMTANEHFREIGHCLETVADGTDVLAKVVLHFN